MAVGKVELRNLDLVDGRWSYQQNLGFVGDDTWVVDDALQVLLVLFNWNMLRCRWERNHRIIRTKKDNLSSVSLVDLGQCDVARLTR